MKVSDVTVIGGAISGGFLAYLLGKRGYFITLIDQNSGQTRKPCGEGLSLLGKRYLDAAGLWSGPLEEAARPFYGFRIEDANGKTLCMDGLSPIGYGIPRNAIDRHIFDSASRISSVDIMPRKALTIRRTGDVWQVQTEQGMVASKQLVLACGLAGRRIAGVPTQDLARQRAEMRYGLVLRVRGAWRNNAPQHIRIRVAHGRQILLTPFKENRVNISVLLSRRRDELAIAKRAIVREALAFAESSGLEDIVIEDCCGTSFIGESRPEFMPELAYFVGDCAEILDPIGGMGMSHALVSASLAADAIVQALRMPRRSTFAWERYKVLREKHVRPLRLATALSYRLNVERGRLLRSIVGRFPRLALGGLMKMELLMPLRGAAARSL